MQRWRLVRRGDAQRGRSQLLPPLNASYHAKYVPCTCAAYPMPHRPGGGVCRWPDPYNDGPREDPSDDEPYDEMPYDDDPYDG